MIVLLGRITEITILSVVICLIWRLLSTIRFNILCIFLRNEPSFHAETRISNTLTAIVGDFSNPISAFVLVAFDFELSLKSLLMLKSQEIWVIQPTSDECLQAELCCCEGIQWFKPFEWEIMRENGWDKCMLDFGRCWCWWNRCRFVVVVVKSGCTHIELRIEISINALQDINIIGGSHVHSGVWSRPWLIMRSFICTFESIYGTCWCLQHLNMPFVS